MRWDSICVYTSISSLKSCVKIPLFPALSELVEETVILWGSIREAVYSNEALACDLYYYT